jgi:putative transposase
MILAHKIAVDANNKQRTYFAKAAGTARFAYNWALAEWQKQYELYKADNRRPRS